METNERGGYFEEGEIYFSVGTNSIPWHTDFLTAIAPDLNEDEDVNYYLSTFAGCVRIRILCLSLLCQAQLISGRWIQDKDLCLSQMILCILVVTAQD